VKRRTKQHPTNWRDFFFRECCWYCLSNICGTKNKALDNRRWVRY